MTFEAMNNKELLDMIYGLSSRIFYGISSDKHESAAKNALLKSKDICKIREIDFSSYEVLPIKNIISKENEDLLLETFNSDSKSYEKETFINFNNKVKAFVEDQLWLGYRVEIFPEKYTKYYVNFEEGIKTMGISIGAKVKDKVDEKLPELDRYNRNNCLHKISNLLENFATENNINLFVSVDDIDYLYYTD